ncbi:MAG: MBL fold metallo-hydrolase [Acutalibacteraceae bacterium]
MRQFLIVGEEEALLIDTGLEESHVAEAVRKITNLPVRVVLTHGDHDHAGGLGDSAPVWSIRRTAICSRRRSVGSRSGRGIPWNAAATVSRCCTFRAIHRAASPCWTGSTACCCPGIPFRRRARSLCSARRRNLERYIESLEKLQPLEPAVRQILPSHGECPIEPVYLSRVLEDALALRDGKLSGEPHAHPALPDLSWESGPPSSQNKA